MLMHKGIRWVYLEPFNSSLGLCEVRGQYIC
jgi:hypothetical protein